MANDFSVRIYDRSWGPVLLPTAVTLTPASWDAEAIGGPASAEIQASGGYEALTDLLHYLGYAVWIMSPDEEYIWYGDIEAVELWNDGVMVGATLEGVVNRVKVLYTVFDAGGAPASGETDWAEDSGSILLYGRRERKHSADAPMRAPQAEAMRDSLLARASRPVATVGGAQAGVGQYATLRCTGFWQRLARVYYTQTNGLIEYTEGGAVWPLGLGFTSTNVAASSRSHRYSIHQLFGRLKEFARPGLQFLASGFAISGNNKAYTVQSGDAKEAVSVTKTTISFDPADDISDSGLNLWPFESGDVIQVSGSVVASGSNNGTHLVKTPGEARIEISPAYHGTPGPAVDIVSEAAGPSINIIRGNSVLTEETVTDERAGASVTITAYGERIAQSFVTGSSEAWTLDAVEVLLRKIGAPTDSVYIQLRADSGGAPAGGAPLDSAFVDDADIEAAEGGSWVSFDMANTVTLNPATTYWLVLIRTGANDSFDFYEVGIDDAGGYAGGTMLLYDGASYQAPANPMSLQFRLLGGVDTATQVKTIAESMGVFTGVTVLAPSGVVTNQYRDGSQTAADEARALLDSGDTASKRLLATIGPQRNLTIRPVGATSEAMHIWRGADYLSTLQGSRETLGLLPAGAWCHLSDPNMQQGALAGLSPFLVDYARYENGAGWELRAQGQPDIWAVSEVPNG